MTKDKLEMLKDKLLNSRNFKDAFNFYFDHFGENRTFLANSKRIEDSFLDGVMTQVGNQIVARRHSPLTKKFLLEYEPLGIKHGACMMDGHLLTIFFIPELNMGLVGVAKSPTDRNATIARFYGETTGDGVSRFMPPKKEQAN